MKKEIVTYGYGSFNDYKGIEHKIIVCAVSKRLDNHEFEVGESDSYFGSGFYDAAKILSFGVAICNPIDSYDKDHGELIAYNRAAKFDNTYPVICTNRAGFFNTTTVTCMINNYIDYIVRDPGSVIDGYDNAKKKFFEEQDLKNDVTHMSPADKANMKYLATCSAENIEYARKVSKYIE